MKIVKKKLSELREAPYNPRISIRDNKEFYDKLRNSIDTFGYVEPIIYNIRSGNVVGGNQRLQIFKDKKIKEIDCIEVDLTDEDEKALNIALNKVAGEWDLPKLNALLIDLKELDYKNINVTGFDIKEINHLFDQYNNPDEEEIFELPKEPKYKIEPGDIYQLGNHRLMCGDSTKKEDVKLLMGGGKADMIFTDIPYGINYSGGRTQTVAKKAYGKIEGDAEKNISSFIEAIIKNGYKKDAYICVSPINLKPVFSTLNNYNAIIIWKKNQPGLGYQWIRRYCEFIIFISNRKKEKHEQSEFDYWEIPTDLKTEYQHGTQKPVKLSIRAISFSSNIGDLCVDWFGGSGSTLIACEQTQRNCYMMEIDPYYCSVIIERWEKYVGGHHVKVNT